MVKMTLARIKYIIIGFAVSVNLYAAEPVRKLHYNYNENVTIWISNQPCGLSKYKKAFPWSAAAVRKDGEILEGCFNGHNNTIEIQWKDGDRSKFPADAFLNNKDTSI
jgi:hypothetical protein